MYFLGTYNHNIDSKNRLSLPTKFVNKLGKSIIISKGYDCCLEIRTIEEFQKFSNKLMSLAQNKKNSRIVIRQLLANAADIEIDKAKRILIPSILLKEANISKDVTLIGVGNKIEIWDKAKYDEFKKNTDEVFSEIAENLEVEENE